MRVYNADLTEKDIENILQCIDLVIIEMDVNSMELFELKDRLNKILEDQ